MIEEIGTSRGLAELGNGGNGFDLRLQTLLKLAIGRLRVSRRQKNKMALGSDGSIEKWAHFGNVVA